MALAFPTGGPRLLKYTVTTKAELYEAYMEFVKNGGLFIRSTDEHHLGDAMILMLEFAESGQRFSLPAKVVWITPRGAPGRRPQGVGVQFQTHPQSREVQTKIQTLLAGHSTEEPTLSL
ncbi:MAG TPA: PilZ domain-containing protein [Nevskiaceae bacterium]